jgi:hypothetical protein
MHRTHHSVFTFVTLGIAFAIACGPKPIEVPEGQDDNDNGGTGTGASGFGGTFSGGSFNGGTATGGAFGGTATGGSFTGGTATGGTFGGTATGGVSGTLATGGALPTGGTPGTGGTAGVGISGAAGSAAGTPGGAGTGAAVTCDPTWKIQTDGFVRSPAAGGACWHGYGFTYAGPATSGSTVMPVNFAMCGAACTMLCASGSVGMTADYSGTGLVGFNLNQAQGGTPLPVTPTGATGLTINFTNTGGSPLRVQLLGPTGDTVATDRWCSTLTATTGPVTIPWAMFNTQCWEGGMGTVYAKQPIKAIQLVVPGSNTAAIPFNMCITDAKDM